MAVLKRLDESIILQDDYKNEKELVEYCLKNNISLNNANLDNLDLSNLNFNDVFIINASFKNANLSEISSKNASFLDCDFSGASLYHCNFLNTELENSKFDNADLRDCVGDMKNIFTIAIDTYVMSFTKTHLSLGCQTKTINEWRNLSSNDFEDEEQKWLWDYYKDIMFQIIDKRLGVEND